MDPFLIFFYGQDLQDLLDFFYFITFQMKVIKLNPLSVEEIFDLIIFEITTTKRMTSFRFHPETGEAKYPLYPVNPV